MRPELVLLEQTVVWDEFTLWRRIKTCCTDWTVTFTVTSCNTTYFQITYFTVAQQANAAKHYTACVCAYHRPRQPLCIPRMLATTESFHWPSSSQTTGRHTSLPADTDRHEADQLDVWSWWLLITRTQILNVQTCVTMERSIMKHNKQHMATAISLL